MFNSFLLSESSVSRLDVGESQDIDLLAEFSSKVEACYVPPEEIDKQVISIQAASKELQHRLTSLNDTIDTLQSTMTEKYLAMKDECRETKSSVAALNDSNKKAREEEAAQKERNDLLQTREQAHEATQKIFDASIDQYKEATETIIKNSNVLKPRN